MRPEKNLPLKITASQSETSQKSMQSWWESVSVMKVAFVSSDLNYSF